ncbi:MAG: stimulus-sensing domain-containing protein [Parvibaculales bacterium]
MLRLPRPFATRRSLLTRLVALNMLGLLVLVIGFLLLHEARQVLTNAYRQSLEAQAKLIAGALSQTAQIDDPFQFFEPSLLDRLLRDGGQQRWALRDARRIMGQARQSSTARLRLYGRDGKLVLDSAQMGRAAQVIARQLPPMDDAAMPDMLAKLPAAVSHLIRPPAPLLSEINAANGRQLEEVVSALRGTAASLQRQSENGADILTVAVPVQGYRAITGALMLSTQPGEIDAIVAQERQLVLQLSAIALVVNLLTSLLLATMLIAPVRKLAAAMRGFAASSPTLPGLDSIPDYAKRGDEIAELSAALRGMTERLLARIHTIDRFAADVAHELKNPLTSLHSAVQNIDALDKQQNPQAHAQMMQIIHHDVQRLNRLISDISNATRLDAELSQGDSELFDVAALAGDLVGAYRDMQDAAAAIELVFRPQGVCLVSAQKPRLAQIIDNLLANALSFSGAGSKVTLSCAVQGDKVELVVADEGPGLAANTEEKIFERFYTDRTQQPMAETGPSATNAAGHSGLGLSISRQIARAYGGDLTAANRPDGVGAYFTLSLPAAANAKQRGPQ